MFLEKRILIKIKKIVKEKDNLTNEDIDNFQKLLKRHLKKAHSIENKLKNQNKPIKITTIIKNVDFGLHILKTLKDPHLHSCSREVQSYLLQAKYGYECWIIEDFFKVKIKTFQQYSLYIIALFLEYLGKIKWALFYTKPI